MELLGESFYAALAVIFLGFLGFLAFSGIVKIYREKKENPFYRYLTIICGVILGSMWAAASVMLIWAAPIQTIIGFVIIFFIMKYIR